MQSVQQQTTMQQQEWQRKYFLSHVHIAAVCGVWSPSSDGVMVILITNITNPRSGWYLALIAH